MLPFLPSTPAASVGCGHTTRVLSSVLLLLLLPPEFSPPRLFSEVEKDTSELKTLIRAEVEQQDRLEAMGYRSPMMIVLLLFLQKQSLAFAVYLFGIGTLHTGPGLKKNTCDNALTMTSPVHW
jgi:hypothetical protein